MAEIRRLQQPDEFEQAIVLANATFRDVEQTSMGISFPNLFSTSLQQSWGVFADSKLVAFMGLAPSVLKIGPARLKVYSMGSVCTHPDYRGRGYASKLLESSIEHISQSGASLLLVSGDRSLYTRAGCAKYSRAVSYSLTLSGNPSLLDGRMNRCKLREMEATDWFGLHELAQARYSCFEQSIWDLAKLIEAKPLASIGKQDHKVLVAECQGKLEAFIVIGLPNKPVVKRKPCVYEWGGDPKYIGALLSYAMNQYTLEELNITIPWHETRLHNVLQSAQSHHTRAKGTLMIVSPERLLEQLMPYLQIKNPKLSENLHMAKIDKDGNTKVTLNEVTCVLSSEQLISFLFDPEFASSSQCGEEFSKLFPVPFPYDGGLNFV